MKSVGKVGCQLWLKYAQDISIRSHEENTISRRVQPACHISALIQDDAGTRTSSCCGVVRTYVDATRGKIGEIDYLQRIEKFS